MADLTAIFAALPKPTTMNFSYPKDWGSDETNTAGAFADGTIAGAGKTFGANTLAGLVGNNATAAGSNKLGLAINKRNKAIFRDLPFRSVSFAWTLRPRNAGKARLFMNMINTLKIWSAPELIADGSLWSVSDITWSLELRAEAANEVIFKANELVITDLSVNYTPNSFWSQHKDGYPTQIELSLNLMELELAHRAKLQSGDIV